VTSRVAALYVDPHGVYANLPDVELWDETRDARNYDGPWPVVAHPPCARWCQLASVNETRWGTPIGDDGGCFWHALDAVRRFGGVLEHPAYSLAWQRYELPRPVSRGGWTSSLTDPGYSIELAQSAYGHPARKRTWLYAIGCELVELPTREPRGVAVVGAGVHTGQAAGRGRLDGYAAIETPEAFRDLLLEMARSAHVEAVPRRSTRKGAVIEG